jgi:hypothetical protein
MAALSGMMEFDLLETPKIVVLVLHRSISTLGSLLFFAAVLGAAEAGVIFNNAGLSGGLRWDAAPRMIGANERSLDGGLRYSLDGGSFAAYRDLFHWSTTPSVEAFQTAVEQAFAAWMAVDPVSGLHTDVSFVADLSTAAVGGTTFLTHSVNGAEIDLMARDSGESRVHAVTAFSSSSATATLTTGMTNYPGSTIFAGVDINMNANPGALYNLDLFRRLLTHEIGHAIGLGDVEAAETQARFIDDNFDGSTSASTLATLTNSWALVVDPHNPAASPLNLYVVPGGDPGNDSLGVNLLMESSGLGITGANGGNPVTALLPLNNDEFATRQFLYPSLTRDVTVTGDYNGDGIVDAADYTVWRDTLGQTVFWKGDKADGDQSGIIDQGDYEFWRTHFGETITPPMGSGATLAVPEPASLGIACVAGLGLGAVGRRRRRRTC